MADDAPFHHTGNPRLHIKLTDAEKAPTDFSTISLMKPTDDNTKNYNKVNIQEQLGELLKTPKEAFNYCEKHQRNQSVQLIEVSNVHGVVMIAFDKVIVLIRPEHLATLFSFKRDAERQIIPSKSISDLKPTIINCGGLVKYIQIYEDVDKGVSNIVSIQVENKIFFFNSSMILSQVNLKQGQIVPLDSLQNFSECFINQGQYIRQLSFHRNAEMSKLLYTQIIYRGTHNNK
ncbi:hypothetical protein FGO68_gene4722 [Halteria grandinella]|uniref:Uncharacterized protein n=1 Tax=Halteria grandinella TaxID=5974 RepID=A0A8J8SXK4_HALGN|nr:hypothetical protein FGO68_gene4722 [Halteria grandinella]